MQAPDNFSWIVAGVLAGSAQPDDALHLEFFRNQDVKHIITLTERPLSHALTPDMAFHHIAIEDFQPPTLCQMEEFVKIVDGARQTNDRVLAHCLRGRGRTGTMLAAYLVYHEGLSAEEAIDRVRRKRPHSVETIAQEQAVIAYADHVRRRDAET